MVVLWPGFRRWGLGYGLGLRVLCATVCSKKSKLMFA